MSDKTCDFMGSLMHGSNPPEKPDSSPPRYEWREGQVWDNKRKCWAIWDCAGGGFGCGADFADLLIAALNSYVDPYGG